MGVSFSPQERAEFCRKAQVVAVKPISENRILLCKQLRGVHFLCRRVLDSVGKLNLLHLDGENARGIKADTRVSKRAF